MARPLLLVENVLSDVQFPAHVVTASGEAAGAEVWRVATGRRSPRDRWTPAVANTEAWIEVDCGAPREIDMIALDRGHNLAGRQVILEHSADGEAWTGVLDVVIPAASVPGAATAAAGVTTPEGAWLKRFDPAEARYFRVRVPAMGAGHRPSIVGLWLGASWAPLSYLDLPYSDGSRDLVYGERVSDAGWAGVSTITRARAGTALLRLESAAEEAQAAYHVGEHFWRRRPMWLLHDADRADRAVLAVPVPGRVGWEVREGWSREQAEIAWTEHEPVLD